MNNIYTVFSMVLDFLNTSLQFRPFSFTIGEYFLAIGMGSLIVAFVRHIFSD